MLDGSVASIEEKGKVLGGKGPNALTWAFSTNEFT